MPNFCHQNAGQNNNLKITNCLKMAEVRYFGITQIKIALT